MRRGASRSAEALLANGDADAPEDRGIASPRTRSAATPRLKLCSLGSKNDNGPSPVTVLLRFSFESRMTKERPRWRPTRDDGFHEIQLNGKQFVFLGMATTSRLDRDLPLRRARRPGRAAARARRRSGERVSGPRIARAAEPAPAPAPNRRLLRSPIRAQRRAAGPRASQRDPAVPACWKRTGTHKDASASQPTPASPAPSASTAAGCAPPPQPAQTPAPAASDALAKTPKPAQTAASTQTKPADGKAAEPPPAPAPRVAEAKPVEPASSRIPGSTALPLLRLRPIPQPPHPPEAGPSPSRSRP